MRTKEKGDLLEEVIRDLSSDFQDTQITKNIKLLGKKTGVLREIDVLIEGKCGIFNVRVAVESKNYTNPVGVEIVESFKAKLEDVCANLGVIVCPNGFTEPAKKRAEFDGIQLFEIYDPRLGNSDWFIPLRYVESGIKCFNFKIAHRTAGPFSVSTDESDWRFHVDGEILTYKELVLYVWNKGMVPQKAGEHVVDYGAIAISDVQNPNTVQYCEIQIHIEVFEKYYLKLYPASFFKRTADGINTYDLRIDTYSKEEDMVRNGWMRFDNFEEMEEAAKTVKQPEDLRDMVIRASYELNLKG